MAQIEAASGGNEGESIATEAADEAMDLQGTVGASTDAAGGVLVAVNRAANKQAASSLATWLVVAEQAEGRAELASVGEVTTHG